MYMSQPDVESAEQIHIIPVGFDYDRLITPISRGEMPADKVLLIDRKSNNGEDESESNLAKEMIRKLEEDFEKFVDVPVEKKYLSTLHNFETVYREAYVMIGEILEDVDEGDKEIWVNISSAPRPVGFAFSAVLESYIADHDTPLYRNSFHIYYISPEDYLITDMRDELESGGEEMTRILTRLEELKDSASEGETETLVDSLKEAISMVEDRRNSMRRLSENIEDLGTTKGAKSIDDSLYMELPTSPDPNLNESERELLRILERGGSAESVSELAERWAEISDKDKEALRSKVQYNVVSLDKKGYVTRERDGRGYRTDLSTMGKLWVETH